MKRMHLIIASTLAVGVAGASAFSLTTVGTADRAVFAPQSFVLPEVLATGPRGAELPGSAQAPVEVDTSYLWAAFEAGDYQSVRDELRVLQRLHPNWTPPDDLVRLTDAMQSRSLVLPAVAAGAYGDALAYYVAHHERFACADVTIESLWAIAEAHAALDDVASAFGVYHRVLDECDAADLRLASLEKAIALQDPERFAALIAVEDERGHDEAEVARLEKIRRDALGEPAAPATPAAPVQLSRLDRTLKAVGAGRASQDDLAWLADHALATGNANAGMVLGYHELDAGRPEAAVQWFERSLGWRRTTKAVEGLYHAYGRLGRHDEQQRLMASHPDTLRRFASANTGGGRENGQLAKAWLALEMGDSERALRFADMAGAETSDADRELVRGWALLQEDRAADAEAAFATAARSSTTEQRTSAEKGRALALIATGRLDEVTVSAALPAEDAADVERAKLEAEILATFERGRHREAHALVQERARRFPDAPSMGAVEGWILFEMGDLNAADEFFTKLHHKERSRETRDALFIVREAMYPNNS